MIKSTFRFPVQLVSGFSGSQFATFTPVDINRVMQWRRPLVAVIVATMICFSADYVVAEEPASQPVNILLITGGCCHDYVFQTKAMQLAFKDLGVAANWTVVNEGGTGTKAKISFYNNPEWAAGFDVVIHNECFAGTKDAEYIRKITSAHKAGVNAVVIHCAMHTYRKADVDDWREFLGVTSRHHEHQSEYPITVTDKEHPAMAGFPQPYRSAKDELYVVEKTWPNTKVLAKSTSEKNGKSYPVIWTNAYGKARVFGTTFGHSNETFQDPTFLKLVVQGTVWAARGDGSDLADKDSADGEAAESKEGEAAPVTAG